jgi:hypothetical protein
LKLSAAIPEHRYPAAVLSLGAAQSRTAGLG